MERILFIKTYVDYHTNGANRSYWSKLFKGISEEQHKANNMIMYSSFDENMPIYEFYSDAKKRFVRVLQYDPLNEVVKSEKYSANRFFTAWIDKRSTIMDGAMEPELVICLLMTQINILKADTLIRSWLNGNDNQTKELIERIYSEQELLDKGID